MKERVEVESLAIQEFRGGHETELHTFLISALGGVKSQVSCSCHLYPHWDISCIPCITVKKKEFICKTFGTPYCIDMCS